MFSFCNLLHSPFPRPSKAHIFPSAPHSQTPSACFSHHVRDQVSHPYKGACKIIVLYMLHFKFLDSKLEGKKKSAPNDSKNSLTSLNLLLISSCVEFLFVKFVPKYLNSFAISKVLFIISVHIVTSSCILMSRHDHVLSFISIYF